MLRKSQNPKEATIADVVPGMPASRAGIAPGMVLLAINGRRWSPEVLKDTLRSTLKPGAGKLDLLVENVGFYKTLVVSYEGGPQSPHLVRLASQPDLLRDIIKPRAAGQQ